VIQDAKEILRGYLSARGINASKQRNIILEQFIDLDSQVDVNELFFALHTRNLKVRHATIYSAVKLFVESGIARAIHLGDGVIRYERATEMGRHEAHHNPLVATTELERRGHRTASVRHYQKNALKLGYSGCVGGVTLQGEQSLPY